MSHTLWMRAMGVGAVLCLSLSAQAGRPLATDDAGALEAGDCELESYAGHGSAKDQPSSQRLLAQLGCGVLAGTQLAVATVRDQGDDQRVHTVNLLAKTRLYQAADDGPGFAVAYGLSWQRSAASGTRHECSLLNGIVSWPLTSDFTLHANLGWSHNASVRADTTNWSVAIEHEAGQGIDLMAEVLDDDRSHQPWLQAGVRWAAVPDKLFLDASYGAQGGSRRARAFTLGLRYAL